MLSIISRKITLKYNREELHSPLQPDRQRVKTGTSALIVMENVTKAKVKCLEIYVIRVGS